MEIIIPNIDYQWFYAALSQSLAALIGIVGMFIVYRLQIQENNINDAIRTLQRSMSVGRPELFFHLSEQETIQEVEYRIKAAKERISSIRESMVCDEEVFKAKQLSEIEFKNRKECNSADIKNREKEIFGFQTRIDNIASKNRWRSKIRKSAILTIVYLVVLFISSIIGLMYSGYFSENSYKGDACTVLIFIFLLAGLYFLIRCFIMSLEFNVHNQLTNMTFSLKGVKMNKITFKDCIGWSIAIIGVIVAIILGLKNKALTIENKQLVDNRQEIHFHAQTIQQNYFNDLPSAVQDHIASIAIASGPVVQNQIFLNIEKK